MSDPAAIRDAIARATDFLIEHPDKARYTDSAATATLASGLSVTVRDPDGRNVTTDMPKGVGGKDSHPSPGWLFRAAIAACDTTLIAMRAATLEIELTDLEVAIDSESNDHGMFGIDESVPAGPSSVRTRIRVAARNAGDKELRDLVDWAVAHCPVCDATKRAIPVTVEVSTG